MTDHEIEKSSSTEGLPIAPDLELSLEVAHIHKHVTIVDRRVGLITFLSAILAIFVGLVAQFLTKLIGFVTNLSFYGKISTEFVSPAGHALGVWGIGIPVMGGLIVGLMARYGSKSIRGHGIPEAMEQILLNKSIIPARITLLKPVSAAIAIGTGGPFGAEGPIIATGGALGSLLGQIISTTSTERKTLLAAGAASGMTATFGSPFSAVLLAIELLLFEFKPRSIIPVSVATSTAAAFRLILNGAAPVFLMPEIPPIAGVALIFYLIEGSLMGVLSVLIAKSVYWIEDRFEYVPVHWMWWPALGGIVVGVIGFLSPHTLGVGYDNIEKILSGSFVGLSLAWFCLCKFLSWSIALGSGTSGGTLAPIFTIGGGMGAIIGVFISNLIPEAQINIALAALIGMAGTFAGASRALLTSIVFAFETTHQSNALIPLLGSCSVSYLVSAFLMRNTIMTEKLARRGHFVPIEYSALHTRHSQ